MKTRGRFGLIAAVATIALTAIACSPGVAAPVASGTPRAGSPVASATAAVAVAVTPTPRPSDGSTATSALNGVYRWVMTKADALAHGLPQDKSAEALAFYPNTTTVTLRDGNADMKASGGGTAKGTYSVNGDRLTLSFPGTTSVMTYSFSTDPNGDLTLTPVQPIDPGDAFVWSTEPWTKIS